MKPRRQTMAMLITQFVLLAAVIAIAGSLLTRFADTIGELTGMGRSLAGLVLLAAATSLPELAVDCAAATIPAIDLAMGDLLGSSLFNLLILAVLDLGRRSGRRMFSPVVAGHAISAIACIVLTAIPLLFIVLPIEVSWGWVGMGTILTGASYLICIRLIYFDQRSVLGIAADEMKIRSREGILRRAVMGYLVSTVVIFAAARYLAPVADQLALRSGLGGTFVGTAFVALTTSLPEMATTWAAVRMGAIELAVGNIFGSNAFNMAILLPVDLFYTQGSLLQDVNDTHAITASTVIIITGIAAMGLLYRPKKKYWLIEPDATLVILLILASMGLVYILK